MGRLRNAKIAGQLRNLEAADVGKALVKLGYEKTDNGGYKMPKNAASEARAYCHKCKAYTMTTRNCDVQLAATSFQLRKEWICLACGDHYPYLEGDEKLIIEKRDAK